MKSLGACTFTFWVAEEKNDSLEMRSQKVNQSYGGNNLQDIAMKLDQITHKAAQTGERLQKIEQARQINERQNLQFEQTSNMHSIFNNESLRPARPKETKFKAKNRKCQTRSRDVTLEQIFEALSCLRDEINMLNENHDEMVQQVNYIKTLIQ